jgi:sugar phosphate isomerase/epimerase
MTLKLAASISPTDAADLRSQAATARKLGLQGVLVPARIGSIDLADLSATGGREFRHAIASADLKLVGIERNLGPAGLSPNADVDREIAALDAAMRATADLGAAMVCCDLGPLPPPPVDPAPIKPKVTQEQAGLILIPDFAGEKKNAPLQTDRPPHLQRDPDFESTIRSALTDLGRRADRYGVTVVFRSSLASLASLHAAIASAACPWFGIDLDPLALLADEQDRDAILSRIASVIRHARARDGVRGAGNRVQPTEIGKGQVDFTRLRADLDAAGYDGFVSLDGISPSTSGAIELLRRVGIAHHD